MYNGKIRSKSNIASIVELFLMFLLLLAVIVVITMVCMTTREQSQYASGLTDAVICAENAAEATKGAASAEEAADLLEKMEGVTDAEVTGDTITATQDGYRIEVVLTPEDGDSGTYLDKQINIYPDSGECIYQLHTGSYSREGER